MHRIKKDTHHSDHLAGGQTTGRERDEVRYCIKVSWSRSIPQRGGSMPQRDIGDMQGAEKHRGPSRQPSQSRADQFVASNGGKMFATTKLRHSLHSLTPSSVVCHTLDQEIISGAFVCISVHALVAACNGCPQQPALDGEGDYRRKVPIDSVRRVLFTQSWCESSRMSFRTDGLCQ